MLKLIAQCDKRQEQLTTSPLLQRWTLARQRLAFIKAQETFRRGSRGPRVGTAVAPPDTTMEANAVEFQFSIPELHRAFMADAPSSDGGRP